MVLIYELKNIHYFYKTIKLSIWGIIGSTFIFFTRDIFHIRQIFNYIFSEILLKFFISHFNTNTYKNVTNRNTFSSQNNEFLTNDPEVILDLEDNKEDIEEENQEEEFF